MHCTMPPSRSRHNYLLVSKHFPGFCKCTMDKIIETIQQIKFPATTWVFPITKGQAVNILVSMLEDFARIGRDARV